MHDAIIIGGGIAGLAAAFELRRRGVAPLVLEAQPRAGGVIVTEHRDGFVIDGGPDSILVQKPAAVALCRDLGVAERLVPTLPPRTAYVLRNGRLLTLPEGSFLGLPTRLGSLLSTPLFSWPAKLRMGLELVRPVRSDLADESIGSFMRRRFGDEAVRYLAEPLLAGIHAGDVEQLSIHALFPRLVDAERRQGSVLRTLFTTHRPPPASSQGAFVSFRDGIAEIVTALVGALGTETIRYGATVTQVAGRDPFRVTLSSGEAMEARTVVIAAPAYAAGPMLAPVDAALAARCSEILYASSATIFFGLRRDQVRHDLRGSGFVVPRAEGRALMAGTWVSSKWPHRAPDGQVLMRGFLGGATDPGILERSDDELAAIAFRELSATVGIDGVPGLTRVFRWHRGTPQYTVGHLARVAEIEARLQKLPGLYVTGSGYRGTGIPDCVADGRSTAAQAAQFLGAAAMPSAPEPIVPSS
jgi:oxygen-dependent protoporphyrinogen oxidase